MSHVTCRSLRARATKACPVDTRLGGWSNGRSVQLVVTALMGTALQGAGRDRCPIGEVAEICNGQGTMPECVTSAMPSVVLDFQLRYGRNGAASVSAFVHSSGVKRTAPTKSFVKSSLNFGRVSPGLATYFMTRSVIAS